MAALRAFSERARQKSITPDIKNHMTRWWQVEATLTPGWYAEVVAAGYPNPAWYVQVTYTIVGENEPVYNDTVILDEALTLVEIVPASYGEMAVSWKPGYCWPGRT